VSRRDLRFAMVVSTSGSAMNEVLKSEFFRSRVHRVVVHDAGPAHDNARRHGVTTTIVPQEDVESFCAEILILFQSDEIDYVFSFYTEFFSTEFRRAYQDRVLNFHPSLLPAFKGMDGFGDTVRYPARFAGNTVELIADAMDEGKIVMQTVCAVDPGAPTELTRHDVFVQQCKALLQTAHWLQEGRITVEGHRVSVAGASYHCASFSPALDSVEAIAWSPPDPYGALR
jgi:phosphoribosylglycinamide formyltransferase-1